jgi:hypothetical protein
MCVFESGLELEPIADKSVSTDVATPDEGYEQHYTDVGPRPECAEGKRARICMAPLGRFLIDS